MKHIEFSQLVDRIEGKLAEAEISRVDGHLAVCGQCSSDQLKLADIFAYVAPAEAESVPQATTARILNIFQRRPAPAATSAPARRSIASLIFDDWQVAVNERFSGIDSHQLLYRVGESEIDLRIDLAGGNGQLSGQIFPEIAEATAELTLGETTVSTPLNTFGEFAFAPLPRGCYDLRIIAGDEVILIEQVPIQQ